MRTVSAKSPRMFELFDRDARLEHLASNFTFTEGPIWNHQGGYLLFSDLPDNIMRKWEPETGISEVRKPNNKGNGMTYDADDRLLICEHATSSVVRKELDGSFTTVASHYRGRELNSPNDIVVASDGAIYFTDPTYGRMPVFGVEREVELSLRGVYRIDPTDGSLQLLAGDFSQPNGICFSPDESLLYVNDTEEAHIRVFEVQDDGTVANGRLFKEGISTDDPSSGRPDGMKCDHRGNVYVTGPRGIWVLSPEAEHLGTIQIPENASNLNWGGSDWETLYITATTSLYRIRTRTAGRAEPYMRVPPRRGQP